MFHRHSSSKLITVHAQASLEILSKNDKFVRRNFVQPQDMNRNTIPL